jgi:hypothetical protein
MNNLKMEFDILGKKIQPLKEEYECRMEEIKKEKEEDISGKQRE